MQIEDILKAAIKDAGLESNLDILNDTTTTTTTTLHINTSNDYTMTSNDDDDFNLNDLDFSILNPITPPQSTSPSSSSSISSSSNASSSSSCSSSSSTLAQQQKQQHHANNALIPDDSDPFLVALKELDENNHKCEVQHQQQYHSVAHPTFKIVSINNAGVSQNNTGNSSDLLSLLSYRTNNPSGLIPRKNVEKIPNAKIVQKNPIIKNLSVANSTPAACSLVPNNSNNFRQITNSAAATTTTTTVVKPVTNSIKVINLSQINQKTSNDKMATNHKLIQITNRPLPIAQTTSNQQQTHLAHSISDSNLIQTSNNYITATTNSNNSSNNIKITKVVSSRPLLNNSNQNLIYFNNIGTQNTTNTKQIANNTFSINGFSSCNSSRAPTTANISIKTNCLKQQPTTMRVVGNNLNNISNQPVQYITKIANSINNSANSTGSLVSNTNNIPRFYAKPARIITTTAAANLNPSTEIVQTKASNCTNSHLNILNSNISRYSKMNNPASNSTPASSATAHLNSSISNSNSSVTINPKYLFNNLNTSSTSASMVQSNESSFASNSTSFNHHYQNYFNEPDEDVVVEEEEELGHAETYANYMPSKLKIGQLHPDPIVETSSLASVEPPDVWYNLKMSESVYANGALSALQLEAIVYACQKHQEFLPNNHRCGFLIGDGAGVGKGRTIAGMIYENYLVGRKKALWLSVSNDLKFDSQRDLADIGASKIQVHSLNKLKYCKISSKQNSKIKKGVIFSTYSSLIGESQHKTTKKKYSSRLKQLIQWLGGESFDGLIVFDECHKAKNLVPNGSARPTKTGLAVLELQEKLPNARIVYASATGASEPKNMAYMVRLGLWGAGTPFVDFNDFIQSIEKRGVGAMEIVAMDMKLRGMYIARQLSFSGVTFKIEEIPLKKEYVKMYNDAVRLWVDMKDKFQEAIDLIDTEGKLKKTVWGQFWSSHQRFFKYLCMACKVPHVIELARAALRNKKCVVIGLQSTGEARTLEQIDELNGEINEFVSTAKGVLQNLIEKHFPSYESLQPNANSKTNGDLLKQQVSKQVRSKESKNSQRVNDILQRLSTYTNKKVERTNLKLKQHQNQKKKGNKRYRSSSMSSLSSMSSVLSSTGSHKSSNQNMHEQDSANHSELESDNFENSEFSDTYDDEDDDEFEFDDEENEEDDDPFKIHELDDLFATNDAKADLKANKKPNLIADLLDFDLSLSTVNTENLFESDDSDSLFSITKSVSVQSLMSKNIIKHRQRRVTNLEKKFRKRKKLAKNKSNNLNGYENEEDDDENECELEVQANLVELDDQQQQVNESSTDDEFKLPTKRVKNKTDSVHNTNDSSNENNDTFLTSCKLETSAPKPRPTQPYEIADYICEMKRELLHAINQLGKRLPANTLDELIDLMDGPDKVAEMTGRKGRVVCRASTNEDTLGSSNFVYETRNETDVPVELMNVVQKEKFMKGEKLIAIISEAASSGISLQANRRYPNQFRRVHITIELPWSADRAIQQFGRTHRSNQVSAPEYVFLISELAGEKRFASTVAKRLESLGALTHGDRRATESRDLSRFNIDNKYGRSALENVIKSICNIEKPIARLPKNYSGNFMKDAREALHGVGMIILNKNGQSAYPEKDYNSINKFLNRLLGCPVELQNAIFTFFSDVLAAVILEAKRTGKWDMGILDLGSNNEIVFRKETKFYVLNSTSESTKRVELHTVLVERGLSWEKALEIYCKSVNKSNDELTAESDSSPEGFYISTQIKNNHKIAILAVSALPASDQSSKLNFLSIYRPNTGLQMRQETTESILKKYKKVTPSEARAHWNEQYVKSAVECTHVYRQAHCVNARNCEVGLRTRKFYILAGSVLTVWSKVETALSNLTCTSQFRLQIIRVKTDDNQKIVGCVIPTMCLKQIDALLSSMSSKTYVQTHHQNENINSANNESKEASNQVSTAKTSITQPILANNKQITPVISFKTKSIYKVDSLSSIKTTNTNVNANSNDNNNNSNTYTLINKKCDSVNYSNPIVNYDFT